MPKSKTKKIYKIKTLPNLQKTKRENCCLSKGKQKKAVVFEEQENRICCSDTSKRGGEDENNVEEKSILSDLYDKFWIMLGY